LLESIATALPRMKSADPIQAIIFAIVHVEHNDLVYQGRSDLLFYACDS
jgi:hypothetical protein